MRLSAAEIDRYAAQGYIIPHHRLAPERVAALDAAVSDLIATNPGVRPEKLVSAHIAGRNAEGVVGDTRFLELARDPTILDMVEQLIGPDIILWGCQVFCKTGGDGLEVPWHQDGHYWPIRPLATCTVWVAVDASCVENGCMRVIPGSHRSRALLPHIEDARTDIVLTRRADDDAFDVTQARDVELEAGQMSLHDVYLIHGSNPNRSPRRRAGVAIRYMPASSHFDRRRHAPGDGSGFLVDFSTRPLWLVRGIDRSGINDFEIGHTTDRQQHCGEGPRARGEQTSRSAR